MKRESNQLENASTSPTTSDTNKLPQEKETIMHKIFCTIFAAMLGAFALSHNATKTMTAKSQTSAVIAAGGKAYLVTETKSGASKRLISTSRPVLSTFGFGPDDVTLAYTTLDGAGVPTPGLYAENIATGDYSKITDGIVFNAKWSPRGDYNIAYTFADEDGTGIATINVASGAQTVLSRDNVLPEALEWDQSGRALYYMHADEASQLVYRQGVKRPVDEQAYTVLTQRAVHFNEFGTPDLTGATSAAPKDALAKLPTVKRQLRKGDLPEAVYEDASPLPADLYAYTINAADGAQIVGDNLLGEGAIRVRAGPGSPERELARGQLVTVMGRGAVVREFKQGETITTYAGFDGKSVALASTTVTYGLPLASAVVTQGGESYASPGNCGLYNHWKSSTMAYAYDFQSSTSGAHVLASAPGLVAYVKKDVSCNNCDKSGCDAYPAGGCSSNNSNGGWGNVVILQHADGTYTKYTHLQANSVQVAVGDNVCAGRYIGRQGFTGCTSGNMEGCGSHLHFQRQSSSALSGTSQAVTFAESPSKALSCGSKYSSSLTETASCANTGQARPVVSSSLKLSSGSPYYVGQTISSSFKITNRGTQSITFARLLTGGRLNNDQSCSGGCPDFSSVSNISLSPGQSYSYSGSRYLDRSGTYSFFVAYQKTDGSWVTNVDKENGATNTLSITVQNAPPKLTDKSPSKIYASAKDQTVYLSGTDLSTTDYVSVQFPGGGTGYIYPSTQIFSRTSSKLGCKIKFGTRGQYYVRAHTPQGGWSNSFGIYAY